MLGPKTYRLQWRRDMRKRYQAFAFVAALLGSAIVVIPLGISTNTLPIVVGHSVFFNGDSFDPCLGSIVGIMRLRVMWFNDQVLVEQYNGDGSYIYATEAGVGDPTKKTLVGDGIFYDFVDPNQQEWHVQEAYWTDSVDTGSGSHIPIPDVDPQHTDLADVQAMAEAGIHAPRNYTWIVDIHKAQRDAWNGADDHTFYNFVTVINTCHFQKNSTALQGIRDDLAPSHLNGHLDTDTGHQHEVYNVDLYVGRAPNILPVGSETPNWAGGQAGIDTGVGQDPLNGPGGG